MGCLERMSDREVVERLGELLREERRLTAAVLMHLGEVEARGLYLPAACPSMFVYCTRVLGMSEDQAFKRIRAARAARRFPVVAMAIEEGRLHLSGVVLVAPHLTDESAEELVAEASGKSRAEIEIVLARRAPRPDVPERLERVAEPAVLVPGPPPDAGAAKVAPLAPERFALQVTIGEETQKKLMRAQALLRHQVPSGDLAEVLDRALDALLDRVEGRKLGKTRGPRAAKKSASRRHVPRAVRREVVARDGARCSFVAEDPRRGSHGVGGVEAEEGEAVGEDAAGGGEEGEAGLAGGGVVDQDAQAGVVVACGVPARVDGDQIEEVAGDEVGLVALGRLDDRVGVVGQRAGERPLEVGGQWRWVGLGEIGDR